MSDVMDRVRKFWDSRPCNIRHSDKPVGTRAYFDEVDARRYFVEPHILKFADFERWRGKRVLEIGCGIGTDTIRFARAGAWVTAVDISGESLAIAYKRARVYGYGYGPVPAANRGCTCAYLGDVERLSEAVPSARYDLAYSFGVLHHTPHPDVALREIRKFVHSGSTVKIMLYHKWSWKALSIRLRGRSIAECSEAQPGCPVTHTYSRAGARRLLEENGFHVTELRVEHVFPWRVSDYVQYRYRKVWYFRWMPRWLFRLLERTMGWHILITAVPK